MRKYLQIALFLGWSLGVACTHTGKNGEHEGKPQAEVWFQGSPEEAFAAAKAQNKFVFLYWGAVWCPPCNELKAEVFSKAQFAELMQNFVPVYLDGDTEAAQIWGERLDAAGYPTVLILDSSQKEMFRLNTVVSIDEFASLVPVLLAESRDFEAAAARVEAGKAGKQDFQNLAFASWDSLPEKKWPEARRLSVLEKAVQSVPADLKKEKALLAGAYLSVLASEKRETKPASLDFVWAALFADQDTVWAARSTVNQNAAWTLAWLGWKPEDKAYQSLKAQWLAAAALVGAHPQASIDTKLWSVNPELAFYRFEHPKEKTSTDLKLKVESAVANADKAAQSDFERHSVISGAAYLLRQVESYDKARALLEAEAKRSNTPWYYYSSLSSLEAEQKNTAAAQKWSALARESVLGRASKIQWITSDLLLNAKDENRKGYVLSVTKNFYSEAMKQKDGFAGRNRARAQKVQEALQRWKADKDFAAVFAEFKSRCTQQDQESQKNCQSHFASLN